MKQHPSKKHSFPFILFLAVFFAFLGVAAAFGDEDYRFGSIDRQTAAAVSIWNAPTPQLYAQPYREATRGLDRPTDWQRVIPDYDLRLYEPDNRRWEPREWKQ